MNEERTDALVAVLLDRSARIDARDDAAMALGESDEQAAYDALMFVACDPAEHTLVAASAGESLGEIVGRRGNTDPLWREQLTPIARMEAMAWLQEVD
jgi:HEAT repeat protein